MSEQRSRQQHTAHSSESTASSDPVSSEAQPTPSGASAEKVAPEMNQTHNVHVGDNVSMNGTLFNVSGAYHWAMVTPDGKDGQLMNPEMPSPSFVAEKEGAYVITLQTDDGEATITVNVAAAE
jgi:hypothetical protein